MTPLKKTLIGSASAIAYGALVWTFSASPPSGDGTLSIVMTSDAEKSATLALVAPTVMWFDAVPSGLGADPVVLPPLDYASTPKTGTTNLMYDPAFHEVFYFWKVTTHPVGYRTTYHDTNYNMPTAWNDRRIAYGQKVAFCFDVPGNYVLECFAVGPTGLTATQTTSFTIADPDTAYSGAATLCVNPAGDTDFAWAPSGSTNYSTGADDRAVVAAMLTDYRSGTTSRRILFKPGATFNMRGAELGNWSNGGDTRLRHYVGSPLGQAPAILDLGVSANGPKFASDGDHASITLSNLEVVGPFDPVALVPKTGDGFPATGAASAWLLLAGNDLTTHLNCFRIRMRDFRGQYFGTPFVQRTDRGVGPRTGFAECDADYSNIITAYFQDPSQRSGGTPIPLDAPHPRVAFIGTKIAAPSNATEFGDHGYNVLNQSWMFRVSYVGEIYIGACDFYVVNYGAPLLRLHEGGTVGAMHDRAGWQYINIDRLVGEGGAGFIAPSSWRAGSPINEGGNPCNLMIDKFLYISTKGPAQGFGGHRVFSPANALCPGTYRNGVAVIPPTFVGTNFIATALAADLGAMNAYELAHPMRIHNLTFVSLGNNSELNNFVRPLMETQAINGLPNLTLENNVVHYPNQTLNNTTEFKQTNMISGPLSGVTPRYPGQKDPQFMWTPAALTSVNIANGGTFLIPYADLNAITTRSDSVGTSRSYVAATQAYWDTNPTHNFHFIRQGSTYRYVYDGGLTVVPEATGLRFTNNGATMTGNWEIWIDRRGLHPGPQASSATPTDMHLSWSPGSGSSALPTDGLRAFDTFLGTVRVGNTIPTGSGLTQATGADPKGAFGQA